MPRLTNQSYLQQRHQLRDQWVDESSNAFLLLAPVEQWALFTYFVPSEKLTDKQLMTHRESISFYDRSLPQRAGRAFSNLQAAIVRLETYRAQALPLPRTRVKKNAEKEIRILSQVHPALDPEKFAKILMGYERRDQ